MESTIEELLVQSLITNDYSRIIENMVDDELIDHGKSISVIFARARTVDDEAHLDLLANCFAKLCFKKPTLERATQYLNQIKNSEAGSKEKAFLKKCLQEVGK
jgi:hypothetical protein